MKFCLTNFLLHGSHRLFSKNLNILTFGLLFSVYRPGLSASHSKIIPIWNDSFFEDPSIANSNISQIKSIFWLCILAKTPGNPFDSIISVSFGSSKKLVSLFFHFISCNENLYPKIMKNACTYIISNSRPQWFIRMTWIFTFFCFQD